MIVPGGGLSSGAARWVPCRPGYFLPERVLSRLFRRLLLTKLLVAHKSGKLRFSGDLAGLSAQTDLVPTQARIVRLVSR
jgi:hypothetical protein